MIIALFALAFAMIVGGLLAILFGWDIVLVERGWTLVLAGSMSAVGGALLLGLTAAIAKLAAIQTHLKRLEGGFAGLSAALPQPASGLSLAALSGGLLEGGAAEAADRAQEERREPDLPLFAERPAPEPDDLFERQEPSLPAAEPEETKPSFEPAAQAQDEEPALKVPDFLLSSRLQETQPRPFNPAEDDKDAAEPVADIVPEREETGITTAAWPEPAPSEPVEPQAAQAANDALEPDEEEREEAAIIGTYNSGDNRYVMFSNGSIEAQTPSGIFRFGSLEELKEFIAAGGETSGKASSASI